MSVAPYKNPKLSIEERIDNLLGQMTIEEKTDQLVQIPFGKGCDPNNLGEAKFRPTAGSVLNSGHGAKVHNQLQRLAVNETRLGIPILFGHDVIHGCVTVYPHSLGQACSFNPELVRQAARIAAKEAVLVGYRWTFSPMVDVGRDPRWGRVVEGYGEDPYVNGVFGAATVRGYQGDDLVAPDSIAACLKHFVGYGASEGGRDYSYSDISMRALWETYLPSFKAGVDAGAATIMSSFNDITGIPSVANPYTLTEALRNRWGFEGFVVSDWRGVQQLGDQGFSRDPAVQTIQCLTAGNDMDMLDQVYMNIPELVRAGRLDIKTVDTSVRRILRIKFRLGLFENPYFEERSFEKSFLLPEYKAIAEELAVETLVLLKNEQGLLPLRQKSVALIGPLAVDRLAMLGSWRGRGREEDAISIQMGLEEKFKGTLHYARGCDFDGDDTAGFAEAVQAAETSDVVVLCLGEKYNWSGENQSRSHIELPVLQEKLLDAVRATGKPIVLLITAGRPIGLHTIEPKVGAILLTWQPGTMAGRAVADVLLGVKNPSGKLASTFPRTTGHIPSYYCEHQRARPESGLYHDIETAPIYEFGHGLSYTTFEYKDLRLNATSIRKDGTLTAHVTLANTGAVAGKETVLWYIRDPEASITQPRRRLIAFEKVELDPGQSRDVTLEIQPMQHLSFPDSDGQRILEAGVFVLEVSRRLDAEFVLE